MRSGGGWVITTLVCCLAPFGVWAQNPVPNSVDVFLQQASQLPVFDLNAAWAAALARGVVGPSTIEARSELSTGRAGIQVSIEKAQVFVIDVPQGRYTLSGNISVGQGQLLVLQGHGGLLDWPSNSTQQLPLSTLVLGNSSTASINILKGGAVYARNLTLVAPRLGPLNTATTFIPAPFVMPSNPWAAALAMESVAIIAGCRHLQALQEYLCGMLTRDSDVPWPTVEIEAGWIFLHRLQAQQANVSIDGMLWACTWPPPRLRGLARESASPASAPQAPSVQRSLLDHLSMLRLTPVGIPTINMPLPAPAFTNLTAEQGTQGLGCAARRVHTSSQLRRALVELQAMSTEFVVIQVIRNLTLQPGSPGAMWPADNAALRVYRNVTITGRHVTSPLTEIDFNKLRNIFWVEHTGQLRFQQLTLTNLPCGPKEYFPASLRVPMMWSVAWDRSLHSDHRIVVEVRNSTLTLPQAQFNYTSYWVGIRASPIPRVRELGAWQVDVNFNGNLAVSNDSHTVFIQNRWGAGLRWLNTSLTDVPVVAPNKHGPAGCGLSSIVPGDPYFPYTRITPVYDAQQLAVYLENPPTPLLMLANNITFSVAQARAAAHSGATGTGNSSNNSAAAGTLSRASIEAQARLNMSAGLLDGSTVNVTQGVTLLGWYEGTTVLDLGNAAGLVQLNLPEGQQFALQRLTLTGLGPAAPTQQPAELANLTASLWAFDFDRHREKLSLVNVTLLLPQAELSRLQDINASTHFAAVPAPALAPSGKPTGPNSAAASLDVLYEFWAEWAAKQQARNSSGSMGIARAGWSGVHAQDVLLTSTLDPALVASLNITTPPQGLTVLEPLAASSAVAGAAAAAEGQGGARRRLSSWKIALMAIGVGLGALAAALFAWWAVRRSKRDQSHRDQRAADGNSARGKPDNQIRQLVTAHRQRSCTQRPQEGMLELEGVTFEALLGRGSFGVVYLGRWRGMTVAVKTITFHDASLRGRRSPRQRAVNEAAVNTLLSHECICNMYTYDVRPVAATGLPDDQLASAQYRLYIIQEYCDEGPLAQAIDRGLFAEAHGGRKLPVILEVAHQIARGLAYIHENNVIHGDLSSGNIMLRSAPGTRLGFQAKVCDFGLSRFLEGPGQSHISNARQGTPYYMAPEVFSHGIISREADTFSFGVILWELVHARRPPWRYPSVISAACWLQQAQHQHTPSGVIPPHALQPAPCDAGCSTPAEVDTAQGAMVLGPGCSEEVASLQHRHTPLLDLSNPSAFTYPLPHDCPPDYAALVTSCLQRTSKARPGIKDVVAALEHMMMDSGLPADVIPHAMRPFSTTWGVSVPAEIIEQAAEEAAVPVAGFWSGPDLHPQLRLKRAVQGSMVLGSAGSSTPAWGHHGNTNCMAPAEGDTSQGASG